MADNGNGENGNTGTGSGESTEEKTSFEGEFDEQRAKRLIENLRDEISGLKEERNTLREQADKVEGLEEQLAKAEGDTKAAQKALYVARAQAKHGLSDEDAEEFLSELDDEEKILARAERLAGRNGGGSQEENGGGEESGEGEETGEESGDLPGKPKPGLTPGTGGSGGGEEIDEDALLKGARERRGY